MKSFFGTAVFFAVIGLCFPAGLFGGGAKDNKEAAPTPAEISAEVSAAEKIDGWFFYEELCGSCHTDVDKFLSILQEALPLNEREQFPNSFNMANIYETSGRALYSQITDDLGIDRSIVEVPLLILGGRVFQGYDSIKSNIQEAYLTAAEDLHVNKKPYSPRTRKTGEHLFDEYTVNPDNITIVYFYRITCPECGTVKPIVDALPKTVTVNGRQRSLDIIRINTRSGNNGERISAFFEAWQVPDKDRMVPIIFFSDSYLAGYEAISAGLEQNLSKVPPPWKLLREQK